MLKIALCCSLALGAAGATLDLKNAVVVAPGNLGPVEKKAVTLLVEEVEKRSGIRWKAGTTIPSDGRPAVVVGRAAGGREGYRVLVSGNTVAVKGNDPRGTLFGVGYLLRNLRMGRGRVTVPSGLNAASAPKVALRGHQLGYRPKTNSYDGWTVAMWEQYIRDLAIFGNNAIELMPPRTDDDSDSPHFPLGQARMMVEMSRIANEYDQDVWVWYPAMDADYSQPDTVEHALEEWGGVFRSLPRVDAVFVPGGDPGHTPPKYLMALLEKQTAMLRRYHPKAQMWVSPQSFNAEWMAEFLELVKAEPAWLAGIVFGPQTRISLPELRKRIPARYPIRLYPDITHGIYCQFPVPDWDLAYVLTEGREPINPRPRDQARIFRLLNPYSNGFITYSEGCNDDVNKIVWNALGWDPEADVVEILREYGRYFIGDGFADDFAHGLLGLEENWRGPLVANRGVEATLTRFQNLERAATPGQRLNWRFQQACYRAYYDAFVRSRLLYETELEDRAAAALRDAPRMGSLTAMAEAERVLDRAVTEPAAGQWRARVFELAEALYQSIRMQLSVPRYQAIAVGRGANLDTIDMPLNNRVWLKGRFAALRAIGSEPERLKGLDEIVNRTDPGPGGFYDDLGDPARQPHLVRGAGFEKDPAFLESSLVGFALRGDFLNHPAAWWHHAEALIDAPLQMRYTGLDPSAEYRLRVVYGGDSTRPKIRLAADEAEVHGLIDRPMPFRPLEFDIPREATADGSLVLTWHREPGLGGNGRGLQVAEVWLVRK